MATIRYQIGQEKNIVLERENYTESIFSEQYINALRVTKYLLGEIKGDSLKLISFCGERGDGKTSCMMTVANLLCECAQKGSVRYDFVKEAGFEDIANIKFATLDVIDPSFFDDSHNVIELIVGQMYTEFKQQSRKCDKFGLKNDLLNAFQNVKKNLCVLHDKKLDAINSMQELDVLASSIGLRHHLGKLIERYLEFIGKDVLLISIDDIDLNIKQAYMMCEQIRKYLAVPKCLVLMGVKIDQLKRVIANKFASEIKNPNQTNNSSQIENNDECEIMADKYVTKLLPTSMRIFMPKVYTFINSQIEIRDGKKIVLSARQLKDAVVELIFQKTRFLFYNQLGNISPIVPNNLRELFVLIGLLSVMESVRDSRCEEEKGILESNKNIFKQYFYNIWRDRFNSKVNNQLEKIINFDFGTSLNKEVVRILAENFNSYLKKDSESSKPEEYEIVGKTRESDSSKQLSTASKNILDSITDDRNFGYNVSVGDVFYLISSLERETLEEHQYSLLFFIKSFYSIRLYEAYDVVTETKGNIYPIPESDLEALSIIDHRFDNTNELQQLVGGSYFTYAAGDLIPVLDGQTLDMRFIKGMPINNLISEIKGEIDEMIAMEGKDQALLSKEDIDKRKEFNLKLNLAEVFIMTIKCAVRAKEMISGGSVSSGKNNINIEEVMSRLRKNVDPFIYRKFGPNTGYYLFDIMAPFANILNPKYTYCKFYNIDEDLFNKILGYPESLLYKMIVKIKREYINHGEDKIWTSLHSLMSESVIRNADVLTSVFNNAIINRAMSHDSATDMMTRFYKNIQNSHLATQKTADDDEPYLIEFHFLEPLAEALQKMFAKDLDSNYINELFKAIFFWQEWKKPETYSTPSVDELKKKISRTRTSKNLVDKLLGIPALARDKEFIEHFFKEDIDRKHKYTESEIWPKIEEFHRQLVDPEARPDIAPVSVETSPESMTTSETSSEPPHAEVATSDELIESTQTEIQA